MWCVASPSAGIAGSCGKEICWGAIGLIQNGNPTRVTNLATAQLAEIAANSSCGGECQNVEVFHSGYSAIARSFDGNAYAGFGHSRTPALKEALEICSSHGNRRCDIQIWACSGEQKPAPVLVSVEASVDDAPSAMVKLTHGQTETQIITSTHPRSQGSVEMVVSGGDSLWGFDPFGGTALRRH